MIYNQMLRLKRLFRSHILAVHSVVDQLTLLWRNRGYLVVVPWNAIGDIVALAAVVREYKKHHPGAKFCVVLDGRKHGVCDTAKMFGSVFDKIDHGKPLILRRVRIPKIYQLRGRLSIIAHPSSGNVNFIDAISCLIDSEHRVKKTKTSTISFTEYNFKESYIHHGRIVLLCPDANSLHFKNGDEIWLSVAKHFTRNGYEVVFNTNNDSHFKGYTTIFYDVKKTAAFAEYCGIVVAARSGLTDLLACATTAKMLVIYSHNFDEWGDEITCPWREEGAIEASELFLKYWSLSAMFERKGLYDCFYESRAELLTQIDKLISSNDNDECGGKNA